MKKGVILCVVVVLDSVDDAVDLLCIDAVCAVAAGYALVATQIVIDANSY